MPGCSPPRDAPSDAHQLTLEEHVPARQRQLQEVDGIFQGIELFEDAPVVEELDSEPVRLRFLLGDGYMRRARRGSVDPTPLRNTHISLRETEGVQGIRDHPFGGQTWRNHLFPGDPLAGYAREFANRFDSVASARYPPAGVPAYPTAVRAIDPADSFVAPDPRLPIADRVAVSAGLQGRAAPSLDHSHGPVFRVRPSTRHGSNRRMSRPPELQQRPQRTEDDILALMNRLVWHGRPTAPSQGGSASVLASYRHLVVLDGDKVSL
jgi:hypothetical protein